ncbi:MAG: DsbA family protein [Acidimicrobiia bacterium]
MTPRTFALTFDYRCPYARIVHDHVVTALQAGAEWNVRFLPFSLGQAHVEHGEPDVWERPELDSGLLALQVGIAVRDLWPDSFLAVHDALFEFRHVRAGNLRDRDALGELLTANGLDADVVFAEVDSGRPLATIKEEHTSFVASHHVWGVPTFVVDEKAVFVRLLDGADGDGLVARRTVDRILDQVEWPILNELKHTSIPR